MIGRACSKHLQCDFIVDARERFGYESDALALRRLRHGQHP